MKQLASNNVTPDEDWEAGLKDADDYVPGERCFRAETETPQSVDDAVDFVRGLLVTTPNRVWIGDERHEIDGLEADARP